MSLRRWHKDATSSMPSLVSLSCLYASSTFASAIIPSSSVCSAIKQAGSFSDASNGVTAVRHEAAIDATIRRYLLLSLSLSKMPSHSSGFTRSLQHVSSSSDCPGIILSFSTSYFASRILA
uniref:Uncharacterized protein n=1 Tax=Opuntia streptacantha TaxID=393608 RepID=A0A7C9ELF7_OPUST